MKKKVRLGQHFLTARWAAHTIVGAADIKAGDTVLEIGPGKGALTRELLHAGARVVAVEKDEALIETLRDKFPEAVAQEKLVLVSEDIRTLTPGALPLSDVYKIVANIPYYITGDIIRSFLTAQKQPSTIVLLVQKEVAERIAKDDKESILSLSVKAYGAPRYIRTVGKKCFSPQPNVDSAILSIEKISRVFFADIDETMFFDVVKTGFASKRKLLVNNLAAMWDKQRAEDAAARCDIPPKARAENVVLRQWKCLCQTLTQSPLL